MRGARKAPPVSRFGRYAPFVKQGLITGGEMIGGHYGGGLGRVAGGAAGSLISRIIGSGGYVSNYGKIKSNALLNNGPPSFVNINGTSGDIIITNREYITDIFSSSTANTFNITQFPINVGLPSTFPWLAGLSSNYTEYKIIGLIFEFKSLSSDSLINSSTSSNVGSISMAFDYTVFNSQTIYSSKFELDNLYASTSEKISCNQMCAMECQNTNVNDFLVRTGSSNITSTSANVAFYDMANFYVGTISPLTSQNLGELYVSYKVLLRKSRIGATLGLNCLYYSASFAPISSSAIMSSSTVPRNLTSVLTNSTIQIAYGNSNTITFPTGLVGKFYVTLILSSNNGGILTSISTTLTNCTPLQYYTSAGGGTSSNYISPGLTVSTLQLTIGQCIDINAVQNQNASISYTIGGTIPFSTAANSNVQLIISNFPQTSLG
jgi:hypothetical protein